MERKLSPKGMILDICSMLCNHTQKSYSSSIMNTTSYLKRILPDSGLSYSKASRLLRKLYSDLCDYDIGLEIPFEFNTTEVLFGIQGLYESVTFNAKSLQYIPRKGEIVQVPFFKEHTGCDYLHVYDVHHEFTDDKHQIYISLRSGTHNEYWRLHKDQAVETGKISFHDHIMKSDYELRKQQDLKPGRPW